MTRKVKNLIAIIVLLFGLGLISYAYEEVHEEARIEFDSKFNLTKDYEDGIDSDRKDNFRKKGGRRNKWKIKERNRWIIRFIFVPTAG